MPRKLNTAALRRRAFAEHVAAGKSASEAARLAGYKAKGHALEVTASRLLRNADVQGWLKARQEEASAERFITAIERREILAQIARGEVAQDISGSGPMGPTSQTRKPSAMERVAAIKHLDELDGLISKKVEHSGPGGQPLGAVLATIPEDEIRNRLAELAKRKSK